MNNINLTNLPKTPLEINKRINEFLYKTLLCTIYKKVGNLAMDFPSFFLIEKIIRLNFDEPGVDLTYCDLF